MKELKDSKKNTFSRRDFILKLGIGASVAITGYYLVNNFVGSTDEPKHELAPNEMPILKPNLVLKEDLGNMLIHNPGSVEPSFMVNDVGKEILLNLNGKRSLQDLSEQVAAKYELTYDEALLSQVAFFVSQLAILGFLQKPFFVNIVENYA